MERVSASSMMDPLQDIAEPSSQAGGTSVKMYLRKGTKNAGQTEEEGEKRESETAVQTPRSVKEEEEVLEAPEQRFPSSLWRNHAGAGLSSRAAAHGGDPCWSRRKV